MKYLLVILLFLSLLFSSSPVRAQGMMGSINQQSGTIDSSQTAQEETEGKAVWDKLQANQIACKDLTNDDYDVLGDYVMGQSIGNTQRHAFMNQMMKNMMGDDGETQMHIALGKRASGCDPSAAFPNNSTNFLPLMGLGGMMGNYFTGGGENGMMGFGGWGNMMNGWNGYGLFGFLPMVIFWLLLILGGVALVRYLGRNNRKDVSNSSLNILKERYAKGDIDKKQFDAMKKDIT